MAFDKAYLKLKQNNPRGIPDEYTYWGRDDTIAQITTAGYFDESAFAPKEDPRRNLTDPTDTDAYAIHVEASDGPYEVQLVGGVASVVGQIVVNLVAGSQPAASSNTSKLFSVLALGGDILIKSNGGDVYVNDTSVIKSNTTLNIAPNTTIKQVDNNNKALLVNEAFTTTWSSVSVSLSAGNRAVVSWSGHGLDYGDSVCLQGANEPVWDQVYRVNHVVDDDSFEILLPFYTLTSPTGTVTAKAMDRNISVNGHFDYNYDNNFSSPQSNNRMCVTLAFIADSNCHVICENVYKYGLLTCATLNCEFWINGRECGDIYKMYGPAIDTHCVVSGMGRDDCASMHSMEPPTFIAYQPAFGSLYNCKITGRGLMNSEDNSSGSIVIYADDTYKSDGLIVDCGNIQSNVRDGFAIKPGDGFNGSPLGSIKVENARLAAEDGSYCFSVSNVVVDRLEVDFTTFIPSNSTTQPFRQEATATIKTLVINGFSFVNTAFSSATEYLFDMNGAIDNFVLREPHVEASALCRLINIGAGGIRNVRIIGGSIDGIDYIATVQASQPGTPNITFDGVHVGVASRCVLALDACRVFLRGNDFEGVTNQIVRMQGADTVHVYDQGGNQYNGTESCDAISGGFVVPHGIELPKNITDTSVAVAAGASCFSIASAGTIPANRAVVSDGTSWFDMTNPSLFYTP